MSKNISKGQQLQLYIQKVLNNVEDDRSKADFLLKDIINEIKNRKDEYKDLGPVAAKYLESLTRCNEQLVRLVSLLKSKNFNEEFNELTNDDKKVLFEIFQNEGNSKTEKLNKNDAA